MPDFNILMRGPQPHEVAAGVQQGFQLGQQQRKQRQLEEAFGKLAASPDDPNAANALMAVDPRMGLQYRQQQVQFGQQQTKLKQEKEERDAKVIASMARDARDPAAWDAAVDQIAAMGYPEAAQFKGKFSPALRSAIMAAGGVKDDGDAGFTLSEGQVRYDANGQRIAAGPAARPRYYPVPQGGRLELDPAYQGGSPATPIPEPGMIDTDEDTGERYRFKGGDHTDPANWEALGGPGLGGPGTFP